MRPITHEQMDKSRGLFSVVVVGGGMKRRKKRGPGGGVRIRGKNRR